MSEETKPSADVVELPPPEFWSPEQAIAAAGRAELHDVLIIGRDRKGELLTFNSRLDIGEILLLLKEVELAAMGLG